MISLTRVVLHQVCEVACHFVVLVTCVKYSSNSCLRNSHAFVMLNLYLHYMSYYCVVVYYIVIPLGSWILEVVVFSIVGRIFCNLSVASLQTLFSVNCPQVFPSVYL
jgi:hypothetical protein